MTVADGTEPLALEPETANPAPADMPDPANPAGEPIEGEEAELELDEVEWEDGRKYQIPKALVPGVMRDKDYRQKTMSLADERRALEAERQTEREFIQSHARELGQLAQIDERIEKYDNVDWDAWYAQDPTSAQAGQFEYNRLHGAREKLNAKIGEARQAETEKAKQATATRLAPVVEHAQKNIPGWNADMDKAIVGHAMRTFDLDHDTLIRIVTPKGYAAMHALWAAATTGQKNPPAQSRQTEAAAVPVTPVARGRAAAQPSALSDKAPVDDWMKGRQAQLAKAGKR